jgi:hypothetical protein
MSNLPALPVILSDGEQFEFNLLFLPTVVDNVYGGYLTISDDTSSGTSKVHFRGYCIDPPQPVPYLQDFNSGAPAYWEGHFNVLNNHGTDNGYGLCCNIYPTDIRYQNTCLLGPLPPNSWLSFDYRMVNSSGYPSTPTDIGIQDSVVISISADYDITFTTIGSINSSNHIPSLEFTSKSFSLSEYEGQTIKVLFYVYAGNVNYYLDIDNFRLDLLPAVLESPVVNISQNNGFISLDWSAVPGALSYVVYATSTPWIADSWILLDMTDQLSYSVAISGDYGFYRVNSSTDSPIP